VRVRAVALGRVTTCVLVAVLAACARPNGQATSSPPRSAVADTTTTTAKRSDQCTDADIQAPASGMPRPQRVVRHLPLTGPQNPESVDPAPRAARPHITAAAAWNVSFSRRNPGSHELLLGQVSSLYPDDRRNATKQNVFAWIIIGRHVPLVFDGGPALVLPSQTRVPQPPCRFGDSFEAINAFTGKGLGYSQHT
jgi:hypothetical protein